MKWGNKSNVSVRSVQTLTTSEQLTASYQPSYGSCNPRSARLIPKLILFLHILSDPRGHCSIYMYSVPVFSFRRCSVNVVGRGGRICSTPDCILSFLKVNARMLSASDITTRTERRISVDSPKYYKFAFADRLAIPKRQEHEPFPSACPSQSTLVRPRCDLQRGPCSLNLLQ